VAVLLVVLLSLPMSTRSPIESIDDECGISLVSASFPDQANLVAITTARVAFVADLLKCVCDCTFESLPEPSNRQQPSGTVLRI